MSNILGLEYNSSRPTMIIPEYGRNVQNMIHFCGTIADREERNKCAQAIIKVMGQLNPQLRDIEDYTHKLWAHLFIMSGFTLDVDSPYEKPTPETFNSKPDLLSYPQKKIKYGHYGKILEEMIEVATKYPSGEEKDYLVKRIANLMKSSYLQWNRDTVNDVTIVQTLEKLSNGALTIEESELTDTAELVKVFKQSSSKQSSSKQLAKRSNKNKRRHK